MIVSFTGKERDAETGLDYFGARYFSGAQGRFTSPDPLLSSGSIYDPQTWNRYSYSLNNPLKYSDPTGMYICDGTKDECRDFKDALADVKQARGNLGTESAGINRHVVGDERALQERRSDSILTSSLAPVAARRQVKRR